MTRDLIIGILVSVVLHGAFFGWERFFPEEEVKPVATFEEPFTIELMEMPPLEPEPEEVFEDNVTDSAEEIEFAPPMQADVPSVQIDSSFVQKLQPPPPPGLDRPTGVITIPQTSATRAIGQGMADLFDLRSLDQAPVTQFQSQPTYPFEMRRAGIEGEVMVHFIVDTNGEVREAYAQSSTHRGFENAAVFAVSKWRFRPGQKAGRAVNTRMQIPIEFKLTE